MNLALSRNSPIHCFVCSNAFEIHNGLIFDLYTGLPHTYVLWSEAQTLSKTKSDENRWNWGRWNRSRSYQHLHVHCSEAQVKHVPSDTSQVHCSKPKVIYIFLLLLWDLDISMAPHTCNCNVTWCTTIIYLLLNYQMKDNRVAYICSTYAMRRSDKRPDRVEISPEQLSAAAIEAEVYSCCQVCYALSTSI